jgi:hypothetical protein
MLAFLLMAALQAPSAPPAPTASPAAAPTRTRERKAVAEPTKGQRKFINGTMGGIDLDALTVRFVDEQGTQRVWKVDAVLAANSPARAEQAAAAFQPGQPIVITYHEDGPEPRVVNVTKRSAEKHDK